METVEWVDFYAPTKIHCENDCLAKIGPWINDTGKRILLLNIQKDNKNPKELNSLKNSLQKYTDGCIIFDEIFGDPDTEQIDSAAHFTKKSHIDMIIAMGSIDTFNAAKAISLLSNNSFFADDLIRGHAKVKHPGLPVVVVPTEPTMGEELSNGFTLIDASTGERRFYSHPSSYPLACFYDPMLSANLTSDQAARIGGAFLVYAIE